MKALDRAKVLVGFVLLFAGLDILLLLSHNNRLVSIPLIAVGLGLLAWGFGLGQGREETEERKGTLSSRLINVFTFGGRLRPALPFLGIGIIALDVAYNIYLSSYTTLGSNDTVILLMGAILFAYNFVPGKYAVERDFALLFSVFLFLILVVPTTAYAIVYGGLREEDTNSPFIYYLLTVPTSGILNLFGVQTWIYPNLHPNPLVQDWTSRLNAIEYATGGAYQPVSIGLSCSGLYSVTIFVSAFLAFVSVEYRKFDRKVALLLLLGVVMAWFANVLRMAIIVWVGHTYGIDALLWTHANLGIFIFMTWVLVFWGLMFKYLGVLEPRGGEGKRPRRKPSTCVLCGGMFSQDAPAERCECGALCHKSCLKGDRCPACGKSLAGKPPK
ncbi:MAG: archaeosortase/exosortase family protein [Euryarchaeota archaeon]|nr:archaeosortase/exosortase family protein [Euryarchaeota archaeon]